MTHHSHSFQCLEEIAGVLVCKHDRDPKKLKASDLPSGSSAALALSKPRSSRPALYRKGRPQDVADPRARFFAGYHAGSGHALSGTPKPWVSPHYDPLYEAGYVRGRNAVEIAGNFDDDPSEAWSQYKGSKTFTSAGSFQTTFQITPRRYDSRGENYENCLSAYKRWMDLVKIGDDPFSATDTVESESGHPLTELSAELKNAVRRAQREAKSDLTIVLHAESPTGKNTKQAYVMKGAI